jgi:hypothetical protein
MWPNLLATFEQAKGKQPMKNQSNLGGTFTLPGTQMTLNRAGYGAMQ